MTTYVALLRGINVGGNNIIKMADLKAAFEKKGYAHVTTYIQSGNVIFSSDEKKIDKLEREIEAFLSQTFKYTSKVMVRTHEQIKKTLANAPSDWKSENVRKYIAFVKAPLTATAAINQVETKEGIDTVKAGNEALYLTTLMSALTKSKFSKLAGKKIYQDLTIRNHNTTQKIEALMQK